ncbi:MAG: S9 family peptidase [Bryobacteraceae bacterium]|nr:S9 family peptidase [Bryobacteraceae bacterium]
MTRRVFKMTMAAGLTLGVALAAEPAAPLIPREALFGNPEKAGAQISPDGKLLAYLAPDEGVLNVWVRTLGKADDRVVTRDRKRGVQIYFWQADSQGILYMQDKDGNEDFHVYRIRLTEKDPVDLTPFDGVRAQPIAYTPRFPNTMLVMLNKRNKQLFDVYRLNVNTGELTVDTENPGGVMGWNADNDLTVRAAQAFTPTGEQEIKLRADAKSEWKPFQKWGPDETLGGVSGFTPDNKSVWLISSVGGETARLVEVDIASGKTTVVGEDPTFDVTGTMTHPRTHKLEGILFTREKPEWKFLDKTVEADFAELRKVKDAQVNVTSRDYDDKKWIVAFTSDDAPVAYYLYDRTSKKAEYLFTNRPKLEQYKLAKMKPVSYTARDGMKLYGYLTMPPGIAKNAPTVLLVHGGPWARDGWGYSGLVQLLANRGYAVLQINFRGSTGYGKKYLNAGDKNWGTSMHDDLIDGKNWAVKMGYADPKRVAIMGGSYGGYATLAGLAFTPDEFVCGVDIVGPSNLVTLLKSIPPYWAPMKALFDKRVGSLDKEEDFLRSRSPLFKAHQIKKPLLIGQGANDPRVKQAESDQIVKAMRDNKLPVEYIVFADEGHGFVRPENTLRFFAAAENFLAKHLVGRAEPPSEKHDWKPFLK